MPTNEDTNPWVWELVAVSEARAFQRRAKIIGEEAAWLGIPQEDVATLQAIALVETSQRGIVWRAVERTFEVVSRPFGVRRKCTLGTFQMTDAPFLLRRQVAEAASRLRTFSEAAPRRTISDIARFGMEHQRASQGLI